jgi:aquaporin Z
MIAAFKTNWRIYFIEAWALGMFMISAVFFTILIEHPAMPVRNFIESALVRRMLIGLAMAITAVLLIYSTWGKKSGAHMNPAVTLTFLALKRINITNVFYYIVFQFAGGLLDVLLMQMIFPVMIKHPSVNYVITIPGNAGTTSAFWAEAIISFLLMFTILIIGNSDLLKYIGYFAGFLLFLFITFEAPFSGMSINPARTVATAIPSFTYSSIWIYFVAPVGAMLMAGLLYKFAYIIRNGNYINMMLHVNGKCEDNETYTPQQTINLNIK